jgi:hypothetical protein
MGLLLEQKILNRSNDTQISMPILGRSVVCQAIVLPPEEGRVHESVKVVVTRKVNPYFSEP